MFRRLRKAKGLTQEALAQKLGICQSSIAMWENRRAVPSLATMKKVAMALDCELIEVVNCFQENVDDLIDKKVE